MEVTMRIHHNFRIIIIWKIRNKNYIETNVNKSNHKNKNLNHTHKFMKLVQIIKIIRLIKFKTIYLKKILII